MGKIIHSVRSLDAAQKFRSLPDTLTTTYAWIHNELYQLKALSLHYRAYLSRTKIDAYAKLSVNSVIPMAVIPMSLNVL